MKKLSDPQLIAASLRFDASDSRQALRFADLMRQSIDWEYHHKRFIDERLEGYFVHNCERAGLLHMLPDATRFCFTGIAAETIERNRVLKQSVRILADYLGSEKIPFLCLKGTHLLGTVYRDYPVRRMSDIDILIHADTLPAVERLLCRHGFSVSAHDNPSVRHSRLLAPVLRELMFERNDCRIDVHWGLAKADGITMMDEGRLWERAGAIPCDGAQFPVLSVEDLFLHLSAHLFKNMMRKKMQLVMFCDIIDLLRQYAASFDWEYVREVCRQENLEPVVYSLLGCLYKEGFCTMPSDMLQETTPYQALYVGGDGRFAWQASSPEGAYYTGIIRGIPGIGDKVFFVMSILFPPKKWLRLYHPDSTIQSTALLYAYHWKISLGKIARATKEFFR